MTRMLNVYPLPTLVEPEDLGGATVVVIDVLRASTTIVYALACGASEVIPCLEVEDARAAAEDFAPGEVLLGGERVGIPIEGFDLGNSPAEYTPDRVGGRALVFTTSNGTRAMWRCRLADRVLIGAFVNASAVCARIVGAERIHLLCAGTAGKPGRDDTLLAGLLVERVLRERGVTYQLNAQALTARHIWRASFASPSVSGADRVEPEVLADELRKSAGGRNLTAVGLGDDILAAAQIDRFGHVPELDTEAFRIRLA